jgi:hypothetical protein
MKILPISLLITLICCFDASSAVRRVPSEYASIQSAVNASNEGDTVLVDSGTYFENINFGKKNITVTSRFFEEDDLSLIQETVINGSLPKHEDSASCVIIIGGQDSTTVLQGFTITGGRGTRWNDEHGAGIYREGGGVLVQHSSPVIQFNIIKDNIVESGRVISTGGGGIRIGDGNPNVKNNLIMRNSARYGSGIVLNHSSGNYENNVVSENFGAMEIAGGAMWINGNSDKPLRIENNSIISNSALSNVCGVVAFRNVSGVFKNNLVWGNYGGNNEQIIARSMAISYCNIMGAHKGTENINAYPDLDTLNYTLNTSSPCIDSGDPDSNFNDPADPLNSSSALPPSRGTVRNDIGAYGGPGSRNITVKEIVK